MIATLALHSFAAARIFATVSACEASSPCDMLSRATFMPAAIMSRKIGNLLQAGPMVATTLVFLNFWRGIELLPLLVRQADHYSIGGHDDHPAN